MEDERATPTPASLAEVQADLYDLITAPEGVAARLLELGRNPTELARIVRPTEKLSAVDRVDIYANMYFYRILDVLRDEYAKVVALVGDTAFHNIVTDYLVACRPAHPSLREVGARLPEYLRRHPLVKDRPWVSELARLERMHLELYDGPDSEVLTLDEIRAVPPADLPAHVLRAIPCHAVLKNRFSSSPLWKADTLGEMPDAVPEISETLLVWRQELTVFHRTVPPDEETVLPLLLEGARFDTVCTRLLDSVPQENAVVRAFELLTGWIGDGLIEATARA